MKTLKLTVGEPCQAHIHRLGGDDYVENIEVPSGTVFTINEDSVDIEPDRVVMRMWKALFSIESQNVKVETV